MPAPRDPYRAADPRQPASLPAARPSGARGDRGQRRAGRPRTGQNRTRLNEDGDLAATAAVLAEMVDPPLVVAVGGDGTVRLAAAAVAGRGIPLAVVPGGTGNVLGSSATRSAASVALSRRSGHGAPQVMGISPPPGGAHSGTTTTSADGADDRRGGLRDGSRHSVHGRRRTSNGNGGWGSAPTSGQCCAS